MKSFISITLILIVFGVTLFSALDQAEPPQTIPETADLGRFSSARALTRLRVIAAHPRPVGSSEHAAVRDYLVRELRNMGLEPQLQKATATLAFDIARVAAVQNIVGEIKGTSNTKAVMLATHYDTVPLAPGAGDAGTAIAAILETIRALRAHPPLENDLIILFTDGEELGLLGAKAFVEKSPLVDEVGVVINFEGRGTAGAAIMFETNDENGWIVGEFAKAFPFKVASSLTYDLYRMLPNNTDFTIFKRKGISGLNFSHIGEVVRYHSARDDLEHLDERTLQHHGENALAAVLHFGNLDLTATTAPTVVYFNFLWPSLVVYPVRWVAPLAVFATVLFAVVLAMGFRKEQFQWRRIFLASLLFSVRIAAASGIVYYLWRLLAPRHAEFGSLYLDAVYGDNWYLVGFLALAVALSTLFGRWSVKKLGTMNLAAGALLWWLPAMWGLSLFFSGASHILLWPLIFSLLALGYTLMADGEGGRSTKSVIVLTIGAVPGLYLFTQLLVLLYDGMTLMLAGVLAGMVAFLFGTLQPHVALLTERRSWLLPTAAALLAIACFGGGLSQSRSSEQFPKPNSLLYACDADSGAAVWASLDEKPDAWTSQFFSSPPETARLPLFFPTRRRPLLVGKAIALEMSPPEVRVISDVRIDGVRTLKLQIRSARGASVLSVHAEEPVPVYEVHVNGETVGGSLLQRAENRRVPRTVQMYSEPTDYMEFDVKTAISGPLRLTVVDRTSGLPEAALGSLWSRPLWMIPHPYSTTDVTLVGKSFAF